MDKPHKTFKLANGRTLELYQDSTHEGPREWDNNGIMVCWHSRYTLGDKHDFETPEAFGAWFKENEADVIAHLPLYLYDHSGITMSTRPFSCPWDSGPVGWIYATRESLESGGHDVASLTKEKVAEWLRGEVATYDQYLRGDVYGFMVRKAPCPHCEAEGEISDEVGDSCWGFYGDDPVENGIVDHLSADDRDALYTQNPELRESAAAMNARFDEAKS